VKISIANSGPKINPAIQNRLFEPFFSTKKVGIGTGLGLSISKNIIEAHAGKLYYDEREPITTFVVELPTVE
jgi:signal transduction histidine kinase